MFTSNGQMVNSISQLKHDLSHINLFYIDNEYPHEPLSMYPRSPTPKGYQSPIDNNCYHCDGFPMQQQLETLNSYSLLNNNMNPNFYSSSQSGQIISSTSPTINHGSIPFSPEFTNRRINRQAQATNQRKQSTPKFDMSTPFFVDRNKQSEYQQCVGPIFGLDQITPDKYHQIQNYAEKLLNDTSLQIQIEGLLSPRISPQPDQNIQQHQELSKAERNRKDSMKLKKQKQPVNNIFKQTKSLPKGAMKSNINPEAPIIAKVPIKRAEKNFTGGSPIKRPSAAAATLRKKGENLNKSSDNLNPKTNSTIIGNNLSVQSKHSKRSLPTLNRSTEPLNKQKTSTPILKRKVIGSNESLKILQQKAPIPMIKAKSPTPSIRLQVPDNNGETMLRASPMRIRTGKSSENLYSNIDKQPVKLPVKSKSFVMSSSGNQTKVKRGTSDLSVGSKGKSSLAINKLREIEKNLHGSISPPEFYLELDKVYGYNGKRVQNLVFLNTKELAFFSGVFAVLWNQQSGKQRFYTEHDHDICCLRVDPSCEYIATGHVTNSTMMIRIWSIKTLKTVKILTNKCELVDMEFTTNNSLFMLTGGKESNISLWNWRLKINIANTTKSLDNNEQLYGLTVHPIETDIVVTYGKMHLVVWHFKKDRSIDNRTALQMQSKIIKTIYCAAFLHDNSLLTGDSQGNLTIWAPYEVDKVLEFAIKEVKGHESQLTCFKMTKENILISGDRDGVIKTWDVNDNEFRLVNAVKLPSISGSVSAITPPNKLDESMDIYIGTSNNFILKGSAIQTEDYQIIFEGHYMAIRTCSLDYDNNIYTASLDRKICKWNDYGLAWKTDSSIQGMSSSVHPAGQVLAVGSATGIIAIVNTGSGEPIQYIQLTTVCIGCMSYSPNGDFLVAGCQDGCLHVIPVRDNGLTYDKVSILKGPLPILTLQWSIDTQFILTSVDDNNFQELILWDLPNTRYIRNVTSFSDNLQWCNVTCSGLEDARGTWDNEKFKDVINICKNYSPTLKCIVTGDENGFIRLFAYPCYDTKASYFQYKQGGGSVTDVKFAPNEAFIATCNFDGTVFVWRLIEYPKLSKTMTKS
uniref:Echinoderm microtubule-associated protein-like 1 n=1 Tax=Dermatophagoides pteronyssinus TaxID=6956 RepID=A0A6P6YH42_DERPT|nr:echinoderm microtubule-associated protein-like 1 [Dermatophagoides pteronyssinus]